MTCVHILITLFIDGFSKLTYRIEIIFCAIDGRYGRQRQCVVCRDDVQGKTAPQLISEQDDERNTLQMKRTKRAKWAVATSAASTLNTNTELTVATTFSRDTNTSDRKRFVVLLYVYLYIYSDEQRQRRAEHSQYKYLPYSRIAPVRSSRPTVRERKAFKHV